MMTQGTFIIPFIEGRREIYTEMIKTYQNYLQCNLNNFESYTFFF